MSFKFALQIYAALIIGQTLAIFVSASFSPTIQNTIIDIFSETIKYSVGAFLGTMAAVAVRVRND